MNWCYDQDEALRTAGGENGGALKSEHLPGHIGSVGVVEQAFGLGHRIVAGTSYMPLPVGLVPGQSRKGYGVRLRFLT